MKDAKENKKLALIRLTVLYNVLCGVLVVCYVAISRFVDFDTLTIVGAGLGGLLVLGAVALICAWLSFKENTECK